MIYFLRIRPLAKQLGHDLFCHLGGPQKGRL